VFETQVTWVVKSWLVPSEYAPVAVNCIKTPAGLFRLAGVIDMEDKVAEVTVKVVLPEILPEVAVMAVTPTETAVARPVLATTVAADVFEELQVTCVVISKLVPSAYVPMAVNWERNPRGTLRLPGVTDIKDKVEGFTTLMVALPDILPEVTILISEAVITAEPGPRAVAKPLLLTVSADGLDELQLTCVVRSWLVPLVYRPVAVNCWVEFTGMTRVAGPTDTEASVTEAGVLLEPLHAARDKARNPRNNTSRTDFIFLMSTIPSQ